MEPDIRQFKLVTGDEIICNIVHEDENEVVLQNVLQMTSVVQEGYKFYTFKAFMTYQDREDSLISVNPEKIVSVANPTEDLIREYLQGLEQLKEYNKSSDIMSDVMDLYSEIGSGDSSDDDNIIPFNRTLH